MDSKILEERENLPPKTGCIKESLRKLHENTPWTIPVYLIQAVILYEYIFEPYTKTDRCIFTYITCLTVNYIFVEKSNFKRHGEKRQ